MHSDRHDTPQDKPEAVALTADWEYMCIGPGSHDTNVLTNYMSMSYNLCLAFH